MKFHFVIPSEARDLTEYVGRSPRFPVSRDEREIPRYARSDGRTEAQGK